MDPVLRTVLEEVLLVRAELRMIRAAFEDDMAKTDALLEEHRVTVRKWIDETFPVKTAELVELPAECQKEPDETCARKNPDALLELGRQGTGTYQRMCRGCGHDPMTGF